MTVMTITLLLGCGTTEKDTSPQASWNSAPLATISGTCPTIDNSQSIQVFTSNGIEREVQFVLPEEPEPTSWNSSSIIT